jgi:dGTPase
LSYLRALAINTLISDAIEVFANNEEAIQNGTFEVSLMDKSKYAAQITDIISLSVTKIYRSQEVIEKEIAGYKIISDILDVYTKALVHEKENKASNYDRLMLSTLPEFYQRTDTSLYNILLNTCCYVASLSDSAAVHIHNKIMGKQL